MNPRPSPRFLAYIPMSARDINTNSAYFQSCGGCFALKLLVENLLSIGCSADFVGMDDHDKFSLYTPALQSGRTIMIYPEPIDGNPLHAAKVVRWVMYYVERERVRQWEMDGEKVVYYWGQFMPEGASGLPLRALDGGMNLFKNRGRERGGVCYKIGKGLDYHKKFTYHQPVELKKNIRALQLEKQLGRFGISFSQIEEPPFELDEILTLEQMADIFNRHSIFVSYDQDSATSILAALCGCLSIIVPGEDGRKKKLLPCFSHGAAYGVEGVVHAIRTMPGLGEFVRQLEKDALETVKAFADVAVGAF